VKNEQHQRYLAQKALYRGSKAAPITADRRCKLFFIVGCNMKITCVWGPRPTGVLTSLVMTETACAEALGQGARSAKRKKDGLTALCHSLTLGFLRNIRPHTDRGETAIEG
jgi:hypothetical protein